MTTATVTLNVAGNATQQLTKIQKQVDVLGKSFSALKNIVGGLAVGTLINNLLRSADAMDDLAKATGFTIAEINGLGNALAANGGKFEDVEQAIGKLSNSIDDARNLNEKAITSFARIGITLDELQQLDSKQILRETLKGLGNLPAGATRTALSMELLGKSAKSIDFKGVNEQLDAFIDNAEEASPSIQSAANLFNNLKSIGRSFGQELGKEFSGVLKTFEQLTSNTTEIAKSLAELTKIVAILGAAFLIFNKVLPAINIFTGMIGSAGTATKVFGQIFKNVKRIFVDFVAIFNVKLFGNFTKDLVIFGQKIANVKGGLLAFINLIANLGRVFFRLAGVVGVIYAIITAIDLLYKTISGDKEGLIDKGIRKIKEYAQALGFLQDTAEQVQEDFSKPLVIEGSGAQKMAEGFFEMGRANKELAKNITEVVNAYRKKNTEALRDLELQAKYADLATDTVEKLQAEEAASQRVLDAVAELNKLKEQAKPFQTDYINKINAEIGALMASIPAQKKAASERVAAIQAIRAAQDQLLKQTELQKKQIEDDASIKALRDQIALIQLYGDELENANIALEVSQTLEQALLELRKQELDLIARKGQLTDEQFQREMAQIEALRQAAYKRAGDEIDARTEVKQAQRAADEDANLGIKKYIEELEKSTTPAKRALESVQSVFNNMDSALETFVRTGKFKFKDFAASIIQDLLMIQAKAALVAAFKTILKGLGIFGFAEGGSPPVGKVSIVGEKGPELFVPKQAGTIIPNDQISGKGRGIGIGGGGPVTNNYNTYNINALDAKSVAQLFAENRKAIFGANKMAEREMSYAGVR